MDCESQDLERSSLTDRLPGVRVHGAGGRGVPGVIAGRRGRRGAEYIHQIDHSRLREEINGEPLRSSADHAGVECLSHL